MRPTTRVLTTVSAALLGLAVAATPAGAAPNPGGWHRYHAAPLTAPAGTLCPFNLDSPVLFDREYTRITRTFPDGTPRVQEFSGPLVVRIVNTDTGASIRRDLSGRAVLQYYRDGSFDFRAQGPVAVGFHPGDHGLPPGYYVMRGQHVIHFAADGTRTLRVDQGSEENVCDTLA